MSINVFGLPTTRPLPRSESSFLSCPVRLPDRSRPLTFPSPTPPSTTSTRGQRWSTWDDIGILAGPEPWPDWVITESAAIDTELGILKTGKEADVYLLERATADRSVVLAAKRYRGHDHRLFHRDAGYTEGRPMRNTRDRRADRQGHPLGAHGPGRRVGPGRVRLPRRPVVGRAAGALPGAAGRRRDPDGVHHPGRRQRRARGWPRPGPDRRLLAAYWDQLTDAMRVLAGLGLAHGDLSAFNLLATEERIVLIDLPQAVDIVSNPQGMEFLARDCRNVATWFRCPRAGRRRRRPARRPVAYAW